MQLIQSAILTAKFDLRNVIELIFTCDNGKNTLRSAKWFSMLAFRSELPFGSVFHGGKWFLILSQKG